MEKVILTLFKTMENKIKALEKEIPEVTRLLNAKEGELAVTKSYMKIITDLIEESAEKHRSDTELQEQKYNLDTLLKDRMKKGVCAHRTMPSPGQYEWCEKLRLNRKKYCKEHS